MAYSVVISPIYNFIKLQLSAMKTTALFLLALTVCVIPMYSQLYFPPTVGNTWETTSPESLGWDVSNIQSLYDFLGTENTKAFIVLKDGKIVLERYFGTFTADSLWYWASAGKTITSVLIGKAQEESKLSINDKTSKYLGVGWTSIPKAKEDLITIRNQLTMTSGLNDRNSNPDCTDDTCLKYLADAGTRWAYHNAPYTLLEKVVVSAVGGTYNQYTRQSLLTPTGMTGAWIPLDDNNVFFSKARSMARFGLLALNDFTWDKTPILSDKTYIQSLTSTSQSLNKSYGYLWWLSGKESYMLPTLQTVFPGSLSPNSPNDAFNALGKNGQIISVSKGKGLVIVRMGDRPNSPSAEIATQLLDLIWQRMNNIMSGTNSVQESESDTISHYPNPVRGTLNLHGYNGKIQIVNSLGITVWEGVVEDRHILDCTTWSNGLYMIHSKNTVQAFIKL
jgi:CubicO group peptidase (beta-lactamase class C family)